MRLKTLDGPLSVHNGNNDIINSPKRINTIQNSNIITNYHNSTTSNFTDTSQFTSGLSDNVINDVITELQTSDLNVLSNVIQDKVQWCNPPRREVQNRELANNCRNINNTLAATLGRRARGRRATPASALCSPESSPDDSLFDVEDAEQSCSSADTSPQDEDLPFDLSDSESSEDGNLSDAAILPQRRGIVNPNYPGFQHLAHTLASDADYTDDDLDFAQPDAEANNNNVTETDYKIDSVNRLDSVENIQKVFYDKPAFNIEQEDGNDQESDSASGNSNNSDEDTEIQVPLNINVDEKGVSKDIVGDFSGEIEAALVRGTFHKNEVFEDPFQPPKLETAVVQQLEEVVEKLLVIKEVEPSITKYNIEPNIEEPFSKLSPTKQFPLHQVLDDTISIKNSDTMAVLQENLSFIVRLDDPIKMKLGDAFLSKGTETIEAPVQKENLHLSHTLNFETEMEVDNEVMKKSELSRKDSNREQEELDCRIKKIKADSEDIEEFRKENLTRDFKEKEEDSAVPRKKEKVDTFLKKRRDYNQEFGSLITFPRRENGVRNRDPINRRSVPMVREKKRNNDALGGFDVYNIETAMPKIDLEAIECHLRAAREEERRAMSQDGVLSMANISEMLRASENSTFRFDASKISLN
ncbi:unnamed protein product [Phaedon cochleariae]|uniref:Uncharacterized protein n=1 Tax=Phaedon cochleariae TaxID=80249 RepID=A0A9P0D9R8_PHACE|nr:unnamed protein product [Phaedon cochleariae]